MQYLWHFFRETEQQQQKSQNLNEDTKDPKSQDNIEEEKQNWRSHTFEFQNLVLR